MIFELEETVSQNARMKVVGIGGGGGNALNRMVDEGLQGVEFISVNTDAQALLNNKADVKVQIGKKLTRGLGAGARPEIGRQAIEENRDEVLHSLQNADLVFVTCGMGGGTGTGAAPIISQIARDLGALTIGIVTKPFLFEGRKRMRQAEMGIAEMRKHVDTMVVVPNERLLAVVGKGIPFQDALKKADEVLLHATQGISSLISVTGIVNVDFADVRTVMQNGGAAIMGTGMGRGENRAMEAVQQAISSPLLDNISITGATGVLINITGGEDLTLGEVTQISDVVKDAAGEDAEIIFGTVNDPAMHGEIRVTVIATGFDRDKAAETPGRAAPGVLPFRERVSRPTPVPPLGYVKPVEAARRGAAPAGAPAATRARVPGAPLEDRQPARAGDRPVVARAAAAGDARRRRLDRNGGNDPVDDRAPASHGCDRVVAVRRVGPSGSRHVPAGRRAACARLGDRRRVRLGGGLHPRRPVGRPVHRAAGAARVPRG